MTDKDELEVIRSNLINAIRHDNTKEALSIIKGTPPEKLLPKDTNHKVNVLQYAIRYKRDDVALALIEQTTPNQLFSPQFHNRTALNDAINFNGESSEVVALALIEKEGVTAEHLLSQDNTTKKTALHDAINAKMTSVVIAIAKKINSKDLKPYEELIQKKFGDDFVTLINSAQTHEPETMNKNRSQFHD